MQLYRGMDIGTAKLHRRRARRASRTTSSTCSTSHEDASVADYQARARAALDADRARAATGRSPSAARGSTCARCSTTWSSPAPTPDVRARLEARVEAEGARALHAELAAVDPVAADGIGPRNARRIVRALEVIALTGRPYSASLPQHVYEVPAVQIGLDCDRAVLDERITERGRADVVARASSTRSSTCARTGWAGRRRAPSGTPRCSRCCAAS